jgi:hypothetical protein
LRHEPLDRLIDPYDVTAQRNGAEKWHAHRRKDPEAKPTKKKWNRRGTMSAGVIDANARLHQRGRGDLP